ncbi:MAG: amino acid ABC transporter permease [Gammaproteobacteria bacterium]|nr:MAG: amino acid ABC transporter permease [Gammaproteobacteria bacterium]
MTDSLYTKTYAPGEHPDLPAPLGERGVIYWLRSNLFSSIGNSILTLLGLALLFYTIPPLLDWAIIRASWGGSDPALCKVEGTGACWTFINARLGQFFYGFFPIEERWRITYPTIAMFALIAYIVLPYAPKKGIASLIILFVFPPIAFILLKGGLFGLSVVPTSQWGGMTLTFVISFVAITLSFPLGIVLALGRRSGMPIVKSFCVVFIELVRGVPMITVLFMSSVMFPLFLPEGWNFDKLLRALIGITLFASAYMAEVVRGGLQAIPKGQVEAAQSLGMNYWKTMGFIVLPQALKIVIPGIVNTFIGLFKDTTLVLIIGLFDFLGIIQAASQDPKWLGYHTEGYVFAAVVYFIFCFSMSRYSMYLEHKLHTGHKR